MKLEPHIILDEDLSVCNVFEALFDLYDAVKKDEMAKTLVGEYIFLMVENSQIVHKLSDEAKIDYIENIKDATEVVSEAQGKSINLAKLICSVKTPSQYAA